MRETGGVSVSQPGFLKCTDGVGCWVGLELIRSPLLPAMPPSTATGTLSIEILEVNDHAPALAPPPSGSLCSEPDQGPGLLLGATDEDLPPHGAPFHFQLNPRVPDLSRNWSLSQINGELSPISPPPAQSWDHNYILGQGWNDFLQYPVGGWGNGQLWFSLHGSGLILELLLTMLHLLQ